MNVALIQCPAWGRDCPPYTLAYFYALLSREGHEVHLFDLNNEMYHEGPPELKKFWDDKDYYSRWENPALLKELVDAHAPLIDRTVRRIVEAGIEAVGFTTHTTSFIMSLEVARRLKEADRDITIVFGGPQCSRSQAAATLIRHPQVDYVCPAEGDIALPRLLQELSSGKRGPLAGFLSKKGEEVIDGGDPEIPLNLDPLPSPDYEPFRGDIERGRYREPHRLDIFDSRGCVTCCHFCSEWQFWKKYRTMSGRRIFDEIRRQAARFPRVNYFYFNGSLVNGDLKVLEEWCDLLTGSGLKIRWAAQAIARADMTRELIQKMRASGCSWLGYGIESGSPRVLERMNKRYPVREAVRVLKDTREAGISVQINIMFGMPTETIDDFEETKLFLIAARPYVDSVLASQSFCVLDKGTYLHRHPRQFGITGEDHHLFWKSNGGENTYAERFRRYEEFCRLALSLGLPETSGVLSVKPDKWLLLGQYHMHEDDYGEAARCLKRSLESESDDAAVRGLLRECLEKAERRE